MMGLTVLSSRLRSNRSVIMSLEGFVVFDGEVNQGLTVHRALPPFDSPGFAEGLMADIRLIFFQPEGTGRMRKTDGRLDRLPLQKPRRGCRRYRPSQHRDL